MITAAVLPPVHLAAAGFGLALWLLLHTLVRTIGWPGALGVLVAIVVVRGLMTRVPRRPPRSPA